MAAPLNWTKTAPGRYVETESGLTIARDENEYKPYGVSGVYGCSGRYSSLRSAMIEGGKMVATVTEARDAEYRFRVLTLDTRTIAK